MPEQAVKMMENWHPAHIFLNIIPDLQKKGVTAQQLDKLIGKNAVDLFAGQKVQVIS